MDIDDILASVSGPSLSLETRDLQELSRAWVNEKSAPEVLQWPGELMDRVLERVRRQVGGLIPLMLQGSCGRELGMNEVLRLKDFGCLD